MMALLFSEGGNASFEQTQLTVDPIDFLTEE